MIDSGKNRLLLEHLTHPLKSFRLHAIETLMVEGVPSALVHHLRERLAHEEDTECRFLLLHLCQNQETKGNEQQKETCSRGDAETQRNEEKAHHAWVQSYSKADGSGRLQLLGTLSPEQKVSLASHAPELLEAESNPAVAGILVKTFTSNWPESQLSFLTAKLSAPSLSLRMAVLETLTRRAPRLLIEFLPPLLTADDPRLRAQAIMGLLNIYSEEAVKHLESLLYSSSLFDKIAALENAFLFPFDAVKSLILQFLSRENDPDLISRASAILAINPDPEVPFGLWGIIESAPSEKARVLKQTLRQACQVLEDSGHLQEGYEAFLAHLQEWINKRKALHLANQVITMLTDTQHPQGEVEAFVFARNDDCLFQETLRQAIHWPISEDIRERLQKIIEEIGPRPSTSASAPEAPFDELSFEEKVRTIALWEEGRREAIKPVLENLLQNKSSPPELKAAAIRGALRLNFTHLAEPVAEYFQHPNGNLATAAIEYLAEVDLDRVLPFLGKFLNSADLRIQTIALRTLNRSDPNQAISALFSALDRGTIEKKQFILSSLIHFDFSLVRPKLTDFLVKNPHRPLLDTGLCFFQTNPDPANLYSLYQIERSVPVGFVETVRIVRHQCAEFLIAEQIISAVSVAEAEAPFPERWAKEQAKKAAPLPSYAYRAIHPEKDSQTVLAALLTNPVKGVMVAGFSFAALVCAFIIFSNDDSTISDKKPDSPLSSIFSAAQPKEKEKSPGDFSLNQLPAPRNIKDTRRLRQTIKRLPFDESLFPINRKDGR